MSKPIPISHIDHLRENARTFTSLVTRPEQINQPVERNSILKTLSTSRAWFALEEDGEWLLVPAKFGGYEGMTSSRYDRYRRSAMHGAEGERACKRVSSYTQSKMGHPARQKLEGLAKRHRGRTTSCLAKLYLVEYQDAWPSLSISDRSSVSAVLSIIRAMSFDDTAAARKAIMEAL